jgi:integrase
MPRPSTGHVRVDTRRRSPTFEARFRAYGKKRSVRLGTIAEGWTETTAKIELENILADVRRGIWQPPIVEVVQAPREIPTFHVFASEWFTRQSLEGGRRGTGLTESGKADLQWRLTNHLLPAFRAKRLDQITVEDVDRYRLAKVAEGRAIQAAAANGKPLTDEYVDKKGRKRHRPRRALSVTSINKTLTTLAAILEAAVEYELIARNPARGRRRRLASTTPRRSWLDRADHITAMLDAAGRLDQGAKVRRGQRRALLATLTFAGLRIGEALSLQWRDVDLARGTIVVRDAKTAAGERTVNILAVLHDELGAYRARLDPAPDALVFGSAAGRQQGASNIRRRVLAKAVEKANKALVKAKAEPLPENLTPHSLRRTYASLLFALGEPPPYVMAQMGHTTPELTLAIYARQMDRRDGEPERLKALVEGREWTAMDGDSNISAPKTPTTTKGTERETAL